MKSEMSQLSSKGSRVVRCMVQFLLEKSWFSPLISALKIQQALAAEMWEDSLSVLKQIPGIGEKMSSSFLEAGVTSFDKALEIGPRQLEKILNRNPPFGDSIIEWIRRVPKYHIQLEPPQNGHMDLKIVISEDWAPGARAESFRRRSSVIVGSDQELLYYFEFSAPKEGSVAQLVHSARIKPSSASSAPVSVRVIQHDVVGFDSSFELPCTWRKTARQPANGAAANPKSKSNAEPPPKPIPSAPKKSSPKAPTAKAASSSALSPSPKLPKNEPPKRAQQTTSNSIHNPRKSCGCDCIRLDKKCSHVCCLLARQAGALPNPPTPRAPSRLEPLYSDAIDDQDTLSSILQDEDDLLDLDPFAKPTPLPPNKPAPVTQTIIPASPRSIHAKPSRAAPLPEQNQKEMARRISAAAITTSPRKNIDPKRKREAITVDEDEFDPVKAFEIMDHKSYLEGAAVPHAAVKPKQIEVAPQLEREPEMPGSKRSKRLERAKQLSPEDDEFIDIAAELMELDRAEQ
eukprot:TRINITY_DN1378_c0_g4_i1.p1 TRINITY_DN1378_c0_g4~~TRINITY_DN1378_c0_g4_i1.p1  ORF type:complete len:515 (+),score=94.35 TRINITY_DN1378_c0_g4_i1:301-1845(+)